MKKLILIFVLAVASTQVVKSQCGVTNSTWSTSGANSVPVFFNATGCIQKGIIQDNGTDVGIGMAGSYKLDVNGDINFANTNALRINGNSILWHNGNTNDMFVGYQAGNAAMTGHSNTLMGNSAGHALTSGAFNTHLGWNAGLSATTDSGTTFVGYEAGKSNTTANYSTAIGYQALHSNAAVLYNTAVGYQALYTNSSCGDCYDNSATNTAVGFQSLYTTQAYGGTCVGFWSGVFNTTGCGTTAFGEEALRRNTTGNYNTGVGVGTLHWNKTGNLNTCIGFNAGVGASGSDTTDINHSNDCFVGAYAGDSVRVDSDNVFIGYASGLNNRYASENTAVGYQSLYSQTYGTSLWNSNNVAIGSGALYSNQPTSTSTGMDNTAVGFQAGYNNTTGDYNTLSGYQAGYGAANNDFYDNCYFGYAAGYSTTNNAWYNVCLGMETGYSNTASHETFVGHTAGNANTTGDLNCFVGYAAGIANTTASDNTGIGGEALGKTTTGGLNVGVGLQSGYTNVTGDSDVFVGTYADANASNLTNCAAFGYGTTATASDKFFFGNTKVIGCYNNTGTWTSSDGRFKINVKNQDIGLDFINKLRPVTYNIDTKALDAFINYDKLQTTDSSGNTSPADRGDFSKSTSIVHSGFIAQEVDSASKALGFNSSIVSEPSNAHDPYALNYAEFVVPLVRAVQQLDSTNKALAAKMQAQDSVINSLQNQITTCCSKDASERMSGSNNSGGNNNGSNYNGSSNNNGAVQESSQQVELGGIAGSNVILYQNEPNPFGDNTVIRYFIPQNITNAQIVFYDEFGKELNRVLIQQNGSGHLDVSSSNLASGIYSYSIVTDNGVVDTKRMVRTK